MKSAREETERRRKYQIEYNKAHGIIPKTIVKEIKNSILITKKEKNKTMDRKDVVKEIERLTGLMKVASAQLDFESCIKLRDDIAELKQLLRKQ